MLGNKEKTNPDSSSLPVLWLNYRFQISRLLGTLNPSKADSAFHPSKVKKFSSVQFTMSGTFRQDV